MEYDNWNMTNKIRIMKTHDEFLNIQKFQILLNFFHSPQFNNKFWNIFQLT